jgi:hypothetical protein
MKTLRDMSLGERSAQLPDLTAADLNACKADMQVQTLDNLEPSVNGSSSSSPVRKRKRVDDEDDGEPNETDAGESREVSLGEKIGDDSHNEEIVVIDLRASKNHPASPSVDANLGCEVTTVETGKDGVSVPSAKRARRIASVVVHTATAATLGAVAAWSALAFS